MDKKLVTTWEMVKALMENPKLKAKLKDGNNTYEIRYSSSGHFTDTGRYYDFSFHRVTDRWEIIKQPKKLKEMSFGEAMAYCYDDVNTKYQDIVSCSSGKNFGVYANEITREEYKSGLWTVRGIYEDD